MHDEGAFSHDHDDKHGVDGTQSSNVFTEHGTHLQHSHDVPMMHAHGKNCN